MSLNKITNNYEAVDGLCLIQRGVNVISASLSRWLTLAKSQGYVCNPPTLGVRLVIFTLCITPVNHPSSSVCQCFLTLFYVTKSFARGEERERERERNNTSSLWSFVIHLFKCACPVEQIYSLHSMTFTGQALVSGLWFSGPHCVWCGCLWRH